jgi:hypothetical protein
MIARNSPSLFPPLATRCALRDHDPADSPHSVTLVGSPPNWEGNSSQSDDGKSEQHRVKCSTYLRNVLLHPSHCRPLIFQTNVKKTGLGKLLRSTESKRIEPVVCRYVDDRLVDSDAFLNQICALVRCARNGRRWRSDRSVGAEFEASTMTTGCVRMRESSL